MIRLIATLILAGLSTMALSDELERDRQGELCAGLVIGRYLPNGTYVDCISDDHAIEVDFSDKWAEAIGQSLMYASVLGRLPGIILICRASTSRDLCFKHTILIEQTLSYWRIGMTLWLCDADDRHLADCTRKDVMQASD